MDKANQQLNELLEYLYIPLIDTFYKEIITDNDPKKIVEVCFLGIACYMHRLNEVFDGKEFTNLRETINFGFKQNLYNFYQNKVGKVSPAIFENLYDKRMNENKNTLNTFIYQNSGFALPVLEYIRFYKKPTQIDISFNDDYNIHQMPELIKRLRNYVNKCEGHLIEFMKKVS